MSDIKMDIGKLINEVKIRPALWNMTIPEYKDRILRKKFWEEITNVFGGEDMPIEEKQKLGDLLHKKWKNIRDRFAREMQENRKKSGARTSRKSPYVYTQQLLFLKDTVTSKPTTSSLPEEDEVLVDQLLEETQTIRSPAKKNIQPIGKKRMHSIEENVHLSPDRCETKAKNKDKVDDNEHFLLSLVPALKSLPRPLNTNCRIELLQCISKYESLGLSQSEQQYEIPTTLHQTQEYHDLQYLAYQHTFTNTQTDNPEQNQLPSPSMYSQLNSTGSASRQEDASPMVSPAHSPVPTLSPDESLTNAAYITTYKTEDDSDYSVFS